MTNLPEFSQISDNLEFLDDWEDRYRYLIELGQSLPPISEDEKSETNKVHGCTSQVWLIVDDNEGKLHFHGDSDAMIVKGLVATLIALYSNLSASEITKIDAIKILDNLNLREHLTSQRSNGLIAMVNRIQDEAKVRL